MRLTESNCPTSCETGVCGPIPYTGEKQGAAFPDQYSCTANGQATVVTCPSGKKLFEVSCSRSDGFDIRINESCRKSYFPFIDFTNSFVWGDATKTRMDNPAGSAGSDVDQLGVHEFKVSRTYTNTVNTL